MTTTDSRPDGRAADELRPITFERDFTRMAEGSCLVSFGETRVLCTASVDEDVPRWMKGRGKGWVTAEYSMLPGSSPERIRREVKDGKPSGRTQEIQRLIGRSLRAVCDMQLLGERQVIVDCDVLGSVSPQTSVPILGWACYLMLNPVSNPQHDWMGLEYRGSSDELSTFGCVTSRLPSGQATGGYAACSRVMPCQRSRRRRTNAGGRLIKFQYPASRTVSPAVCAVFRRLRAV